MNNSVQAATRVLDFQNTGTESGCVHWNGTANVVGSCTLGGAGFTGGNEGPQSQTRTAGDLGISSGADLRIVFDAVEPGAGAITLELLRLLVLDPTNGNLIFSANLAAPVLLDPTLTGTGQSDLVLGLDAADRLAFDDAVAASGVLLANVRIGIYATASGAAGGPESIYVGNRATYDPSAVPEPSTYALVAAGLAALWARRRAQHQR